MNNVKPFFILSTFKSGYKQGGVYDTNSIAPTLTFNNNNVISIVEYELLQDIELHKATI